MCAFFLRNGSKALHHLCKKNPIEPLIFKNHIVHHQLQHSKVYSRLPQSFYRKNKELVELSNPSFLSFFSGVSASASKVGFVGWYLEKINSRPILTKSITCGLILTAADFSSQTIAGSLMEQYDLARTLRMAGYGALIVGPSLHFWFNFLSRCFPKRDVITTFKKIALGQTVYGPAINSIFFSMNAAAQGESSSEIVARLKRDLVPTVVNGLMYWPICDFITFKFVPVHLQPLVSNTFSYLWNVYLTYMASQEKVSTT
ncbi:uncharacterized protein LOC107771259 [Nicotiana tabacum]|uniref:PXMP2/4 family protein 4 n=1 Tax=Nicotiana tabacum TaxID=4097 RepID=A0A1S3Y2A0_TOBAC|nr:PXMP2/4 family protein 4-like [Nicotiana tomentosiformis]XP_016446087.1 PREDICTED: PXMP2/4 family protein 4-like [Nicotiana tabacum]